MKLAPLPAPAVLAALTLFAVAALGAQPAFAASENISVLVLEDDPPFAPVPGAVVTLRGTDPTSQNGLTMTTGGGGTVTFNGVTGPYSVTAQKDYLIDGLTSRVAFSLVDIAPVVSGVPAAGTIGIFFEVPAAPPSNPPATLSGNIANPPTLMGSEFLEVVAVERSDGETVGWADGSSGFYAMSIPSGIVVDCYVAHRTSFGSSAVKASLIKTGVGPVPLGGLTQNFNFANAIPWTTTVNVSESGRASGLWMGVQLEVRDPATGIELDFSIHDASTAPSTIQLPNLALPAFAPFRVELSADAFDPFEVIPGEQYRTFMLTSTPGSVTFDFMPLPTPIQPTNGSVLSPSELASLAVQFVEGTPPAGFGNNGVNGFFLESDEGDPCPPPPGIDNAGWTIFARGGDQDFDMPPHSLPMFTTGQNLYSGFLHYRAKGYSLGFESFFDANLAANLAALNSSATEACDSEVIIGLVLDTDDYCSPGTSASGCQATLSTSGFASATAPSGFDVQAATVEGNKSGIFFFGTNGRQANPWGTSSSFQCVVPPVKRTGLLTGGGTNGNCNGVFSKDMNTHFANQPAHNPGLGATVQLQLWYRDPVNTSNQTTSLSNAIEFCVGQ